MEKSRITFITGGARSGKSSFAEMYAMNIAEKEDLKLYYAATANKSDDEMIERINRHQADRERSQRQWETIETPHMLANKVNVFSPNSIVLLDCLTILLSNELFQNGLFQENCDYEMVQAKVTSGIIDGIDALARRVKVLVIVSNEVVYDANMHHGKVVETYQETLGLLHQQIVRKARSAYAVEVGLPLLMKGTDA